MFSRVSIEWQTDFQVQEKLLKHNSDGTDKKNIIWSVCDVYVFIATERSLRKRSGVYILLK